MSYSKEYLFEVSRIADSLVTQNSQNLENLAAEIAALRERGGTLYIVGLGGSAANATHMSADFRKLCRVDARSLDNIAEITARANDEGWDSIFDGFIAGMRSIDALFVLSVGGGTPEVSRPIFNAIKKAAIIGTKIFGIVGPNGGATFKHGDCVIRIQCESYITPYTEAFQAVIWHYLVSHPLLQKVPTKWK